MQTTRRRILEYLETQGPASAGSIQQALRMTIANIRHHLRRLERDGLVKLVGVQASAGRGRPTHLFGLTPRGAQGDLAQLTLALWQAYMGDQTLETATLKLQALAEMITPIEVSPGGSLTQRLYQAIRQLRNLDYEARWEAHADSPLIILEKCPFGALHPDLPAICSLDAQILQKLVGQPVEQLTTRSLTSGSQPHCIFRVTTG